MVVVPSTQPLRGWVDHKATTEDVVSQGLALSHAISAA
jgi:hypothetical protein